MKLSADRTTVGLQTCASPFRSPYEATNALHTPVNQKSNRWISHYEILGKKGNEGLYLPIVIHLKGKNVYSCGL